MPTIQNRRGTKSQWAAWNSVLAAGEIGVELGDKLKFKMGDGLTAWDGLKYFVDEDSVTGSGGVLAPLLEDYTKVLNIGSSTAAGWASRLVTALATYGMTLSTAATAAGSWQISHMAAATGIRPLTTEAFTIPAVGGVNVTLLNMSEANNTAATYNWPGSFGGVVGTLSSPSGNQVWTFTRSASGPALVIPKGTAFVPSIPASYKRSVVVINAGKNTLTTTRTGWDAQRVIDLTDQMVESFGGASGRVLVVGQFNNTNHPATSASRSAIDKVNAYQKNKYGDRFFDLHGYLTGTQIWTDTALAPTATDTAQQALGNKPPSLSSDDGHMNGAAYLAVVNRMVAQMAALAWLPGPPPPQASERTVIATENFNQTDGTVVGKTTTTGNLVWALLPGGSGGTDLHTIGNRVANTQTLARRSCIPVSGNNYRNTVTIAALGADPASKAMRVLARIQSPTSYYFVSPRRSNTAEGISIWKTKDGTVTSLKSDGAVLPKATDTLGIEVDGPAIRLYLNGDLKLETTDPDFTSGPAGLEVQVVGPEADDLVLELLTPISE